MTFQIEAPDLSSEAAERRWFADLLCQAFPMCRSEAEMCERASAVLSRKGKQVTPRAIRNWLRCENTPHFRYVLTVYALAQAEKIARCVTPDP